MSAEIHNVVADDVLVVGGGLIGAATALALAQSGWRVRLLEAGSGPQAIPAASDVTARVSAISPASFNLLNHLGVWSRMDAAQVLPYQAMQVWESDILTNGMHFTASENGVPALGYFLENETLRAALWQALEGAGVAIETGVVLERVTVRAAFVDAASAAQRYRARLIAVTDGAESSVRSMLGIDVQREAYGHDALVTTVRTEHAHQDTAWQRFLPGGPLAFLPLADGRCSIVWSQPPEHAAENAALDDAAFCLALSDALGETLLGRVLNATPRITFPLQKRQAEHYVRPRVALLGDAAHTLHPLAGQGVNLGFQDVAALAAVLGRAVSGTVQDPGEFARLRRYERARRGDNVLMQAGMAGLKSLFEQEQAPLRALRRWGLAAVGKSALLKRQFALQAMDSRLESWPLLEPHLQIQ
ncbi:MAG: FAD-dependent oxidoreductase [Gammaproteobacteria bacterium]